jgi:DNA modification methylase
LFGNNIDTLKTIPDGAVDCCVTSPPYFGLRDYGAEGQIGLEETPEEYIEKLVLVFREVRRVLRDDGTLWLNIGDSYAGSGKGAGDTKKASKKQPLASYNGNKAGAFKDAVIKPKDLIGIPWMLAFALRADGWYLRQDIIWHKPNAMPESVTDRCTKSHEYIFLLSKSERYYFNNDEIKEKAVGIPGGASKKIHDKNAQGKHGKTSCFNIPWNADNEYRNKRDVWIVYTKPNNDAHFAVFPERLILPCVLAGSRLGGCVIDPFLGSGTTAIVAIKNFRKYIGCEINPEYIKIAEQRIACEKGLWDE